MILVADSGSTKCDWLIVDESEQIIAKTMGFNPFFHPTDLIQSEIEKSETLIKYAPSIKEVYYYGAGCSSPERNLIVERALRNIFTNTDELVVDEDMVGAALAVCGEEEGIACILGTGSNSCYYDGNKTHSEVPALGYIFGDEGSGSYFGKQLLSSYLYNRMPEDLATEFESLYDVSKETVFTHVYHRPHVNVYLASFMRFVSKHEDHPYFEDMIYKGLQHFTDIHIKCFAKHQEVKVHFVGSIAYYFREQLERVCREMSVEIGNIVKKPIFPLADFYMNKAKSRVIQ